MYKSGLAMAGLSILGFPHILRSGLRGEKPEISAARLGFIALMDAAPLFVAYEKGFFAEQGMPGIEVVKQSSWGATRDNLILGSARNGIDGSHILTPIPYLMSLGQITPNNVPVPIQLLARLNVSGQCISVHRRYRSDNVTVDASGFAKAIAARRRDGHRVSAAHTFPGGTHDMLIRYWLAASGIDPDRDIATMTVPPAQMVANMRVNNMDAFCVAEPWHQQLINQRIGFTACITGELWKHHPEKAFCMRADFVTQYPKATKAIVRALMQAAAYCDDPSNVEEVARICSRRRWIKAPYSVIIDRMRGHFDYGDGRVVEDSPHKMFYWKHHANFPFRSHDQWFLVENIRWGNLPRDLAIEPLLNRVNRADLWREAAAELGVAASDIPVSDSRGVEHFFDGKTFDPQNPAPYLQSLNIKRIQDL